MNTGHATVIVRAIDNAGNVRDESVNVTIPTPFGLFVETNSLAITFFLLVLMVLILLVHYFFGHKIIARTRRLIGAIEKEEREEKIEEAQEALDEAKKK